MRVADETPVIIVEFAVARQVFAVEFAAAARQEVAELAHQHHAAVGEDPRCQGGIHLRGDIPVKGREHFKAVAVGIAEARKQETGLAFVTQREGGVGGIEYRHALDAEHHVPGFPPVVFVIERDLAGRQVPEIIFRIAGAVVHFGEFRFALVFMVDAVRLAPRAVPPHDITGIFEPAAFLFKFDARRFSADINGIVPVFDIAFEFRGRPRLVIGDGIGAELLPVPADLHVAAQHRNALLFKLGLIRGDVGLAGFKRDSNRRPGGDTQRLRA